jgi:THO complex subunit 2
LTTLPALSLLPANSSAAKHSAAERRKRTATFYKQKKYNVSREASEGYTAFLVLLSDDRYLGKGGEDEDATDRRRRAKALWKECLAIIGWYDLSPQRVLDLMLDAFCQKLASHWRFHIDLFECTPWSRRNLSLAKSNEDADAEERGMTMDQAAEPSGMTDFKGRLGEETGNRVLTQVLGFKFASHRYDERDLKGVEQNPTVASQELFYVTAILIRQGFVRTVDILNHLTPDDATMDSLVRVYKIKTQQDIRNLGGNALVMAAALPDDDSPLGPSAKTSVDPDLPKPRKEIPEQKIQLCEALLAIGQVSSAFYIISRWPIIAQYSERVAILIMRIVRYALKPAYDVVEAARNEGTPPPGLNYRTHFAFGEPEVVDSIYCPEPIDTERRRFRFFFREWHSLLERWTDPIEVITKVQPLMSIVGARAASDASVLIWLCRLGVYHTTRDVSHR